MTTDTERSPLMKMLCPDCKGQYTTGNYYADALGLHGSCSVCGGAGWVDAPLVEDREAYPQRVYPVDPGVWLFLTRLEEKLDRILDALGESEAQS